MPNRNEPPEATDVQSVRVIFQFYDPKSKNYKYRKGFSVSGKLPNMQTAYELMGKIVAAMKDLAVPGVADRLGRHAAGDPVDSSGVQE